ncbi:ABC transporter ATP-binding protein [Microvirga lotononidis]|uniref:Spermidine/putrescine import ATP-binding protein PotA n=2 Tax=Microvirga lotononidis TaxID=864069 RepID=I4YR11_9HYPH|nr:ABC transporter ATP-binding protein [Microvirga lotononidis]EIM26403.1 spermidine/putrescine ABC transporter ATP-binding subunit [Microvirga lotononidis]
MKVRLTGLRKSYGEVHALRDTSLTVPAGEFLTLLGPSGSGKTTLLMMLAGLIVPDAGEVWIDGKDATFEPVFKRDIGMVFQNYALFPHLTVYENIAFPLRMRRMSEAGIREKVERILEIVRLPQVAQRLPRELSGGQQQRIALARCAVYEPSIILMDEPLGALDKKLRDHMQLEIKRLHTELGATILYVTHDQEEAMAMSDRICLMNNGRIEQLGTPADLYFRPISVFAADFLGGSNIFKATVSDVGVNVCLRGPGDSSVKADALGSLTVGQAVDVMVRPEHIRLLANGDTSDNAVSGILEQSIMVGPVTRYYGRLSDGTSIGAMHLTRSPHRAAQPGDAVRFGWSQEHTVVIQHAAAVSL